MNRSGHTVMVTGGASGIGLALTERFLQNGNRVIAIGRSKDKLESLRQRHPGIATYACDLADPAQVDQLAIWTRMHHPDLNLLVNNAGIQHNYEFDGQTDQSSRVAEEIAINLTSPILLINRLLPLLTGRPQAAIVNVSSGLGLVPKRSAPVYCGTKAALHLFTQALRYQLEPQGIRVFEILPPVVDTDMTRGRGHKKISPEALADEFMIAFERDRREIPIGRVKLLMRLNRWVPGVAARILKNS